MTDLVTLAGGTVLDELYVPLECSARDFDRVIRRIRKVSPDVVFSTVVGSGTALFYRSFHEAGLDPERMPIAGLTTSEAEIAEMSPAVARGHVTAAPFFEALDTPAAARFVAAYKRRWGEHSPVTACAEAAYFQIKLYAEALARAGGDDPDALLRQLLGLEIEAPQGRVRIDPENHHAELWPRVGRVGADGRFEVVWDPGVRVRPDPYFVAPTSDDWSAARLASTVP